MAGNYYEFGDVKITIYGKDGRSFIFDGSTPTDVVEELNNLRQIAERLAIYTSQLHIVMNYLAQKWNNVHGFDLLAKAAKYRVDFVDPVLATNKWDKENMDESMALSKQLLAKKEEPKVNIIGLNGTKE